jgi:predicted hydrolase (HD superfamily)
MNRDKALEVVKQYTKNNNLVKHMLAVEAAMVFYAKKFGEDEEKWAVTGLVHDFDYEKMKDEHPSEWGYAILRENGADEDVIQAIIGHADRLNTESRPTLMAKTLFAVDELTGFIVGCSLPRPEQISTLKVKSVKKKMKNLKFCEAVSRDDLRAGAEEIGIDLDEHITNVIEAMQGIKEELGLK